MKSLASPVFNLKALEFGHFSPIFTFLGTLKWYNVSKNCAEAFRFQQTFKQKKPFEDSPSGFKISF